MITTQPNNILTIRQAVQRAHADGLPISEGALRSWIRSGVLPVRKVGNRNLVYYPTLIAYLCNTESRASTPTDITPGSRSYGEDSS
jgi:hypothetical protein